jgi:predicted N-acetyltransferase YhbS
LALANILKTPSQLQHCLNQASLPITFVALSDSQVIGTVTLDTSDLPHFDHLTPWLASLYVLPSRRGEGIGRALVEHVVSHAQSQIISPIYLWTPGSTRLYEKCGWQFFCCDTYSGQPITLMRLVTQPQQLAS